MKKCLSAGWQCPGPQPGGAGLRDQRQHRKGEGGRQDSRPPSSPASERHSFGMFSFGVSRTYICVYLVKQQVWGGKWKGEVAFQLRWFD